MTNTVTVTKKPKRGNSHARTIQEDGSGKLPGCSIAQNSMVLITRHFVPVSFVAKDWHVTPRRIRLLLAEQRLDGRRGDNGYWEVAYPYRFVIGTRGPALKRSQPPKRGRPKAALKAV